MKYHFDFTLSSDETDMLFGMINMQILDVQARMEKDNQDDATVSWLADHLKFLYELKGKLDFVKVETNEA